MNSQHSYKILILEKLGFYIFIFLLLMSPCYSFATSGEKPLSTTVLERELMNALAQGRRSGCNGLPGTDSPLFREKIFDHVAFHLSNGDSIESAMAKSQSKPNGGAYIKIPFQKNRSGFLSMTVRAFCNDLVKPQWSDIGFYISPKATWIHIGTAFHPPKDIDYISIINKGLGLVNAARATARTCGTDSYPAAPPLVISEVLNQAAIDHAKDMAINRYYSHVGMDGSSVADRVGRAGYQSRFVSENNNIGPATIEHSVKDWLTSPGHCKNLMQADVTEMGIGYAVNLNFRQGVIWVQIFGNPKK